MIKKFLPIALIFTATLFAAPVPTVSGISPEKEMMGEAFSIDDVCFDNTGDATGFAPKYELFTSKGVQFSSASFSGGTESQNVLSCAIDSPTECNTTNPDTGKLITLQPGEAFWIISYPLGSFPTDMPKQCMKFDFRLGNTPDVSINVPENIVVTPYFALGADGRYNPNIDPPIYGNNIALEVIPVVFKITKTFNAPEKETVTGRHFAKSFTLGLNIARDENVSNVVISDILPNELQYISPLMNLPADCTISQEPNDSVPGGTLEFTCSKLKGASSDGVIEHNVTVNFYVPDILSDCTGSVLNKVDAKYDYTDLNTSSTGTYTDDDNDTINIKAMAVQKSVELYEDNGVPDVSPDDILKYTITMQLSDYFDANNTIFRDVLDTTQSAIDLNNSTWSIDSNATTANGNFVDGSTVTTHITGGGLQNVDFDLAAAAGVDLIGGDGTSKGTRVTITFFAKVNENYRPSGEPMRSGDYIRNNIEIEAQINGATRSCDTSSSETQVAIASGSKTVYAINGVELGSGPFLVKPDDNVTYKLTVNFPINSYEYVTLSDYLPSPIFTTDGFANGDAPIADGNNTTIIPGWGEWSTGPDNTTDVLGLGVSLGVVPGQNMLVWEYTLDDNETVVTKASKLVLLFTVKASDTPLADQLSLANLATLDYNGTTQEFFGSDIVPIVTLQPVLSIDKNITATSNSRGQTLPTKTLDQVDAGDIITYTVGISNTGHAAAYDVNVTDTLSRPALENCIRISSTDDSQIVGSELSSFRVRFIDKNSTFYMDYNCTVIQNANPGGDIVNEANVTAYSNIPGGQNFLANKDPLTSKATLVMLEDTQLTKTIYDTSLPSTPGTNLNPGEIAFFEINATLGEGTYVNFSIADSKCDNTPYLYSSSSNIALTGNDVIVTGTPTNSHGSLIYRCQYQTKANESGSQTNTAVMNADNISERSANVSWTVTPPNPNPQKVMNPGKADAGDKISITMNWDSNNTDNPSYRCSVTDKLDPRFDFNSITNIVSPTGYTCTADTGTGVVTCLYADTNKTCGPGPATFDATLKADILVGGSLDNVIEFKGHALPEDHNNSDASDYDYKTDDNDTAVLKLRSPGKPVKIFTATSEDFTDPGDTQLSAIPDVAVGEIVNVSITYAFFEGRTKQVSLQDIFLTKGLSYVPGSMTISRSSLNLQVEKSDINSSLGTVGVPVAVDENNIVKNENHLSVYLGDVYNLDSQDGIHSESFTLSFKVKVKNNINVNAGTNIQDRGRTVFHDSVTDKRRIAQSKIREMNVVEPKPTLRKVTDIVTVQGGSTVNYTLYACNDESNTSSGLTTGFDWNLTDTHPEYLDIVPGSISSSPTVPITETSSKEFNATITKLEPGECVEFKYQAKVDPNVPFGEVMTNSAALRATSLPGEYGSAGNTTLADDGSGEINGERTGSRVGPNDLYAHADASVVSEIAGIAKRLVSPDRYYAIGEKASYSIRVGLVKGTAQNFSVHDTLPIGLTIDESSITYSHVGTVDPEAPLDYNITGDASTGQTIVFNYEELNATALSGLEIDYKVTVINNMTNQDGTKLVNRAFVTFDDPMDPTQEIHIDQFSPTDPIKVGEPNLFLQKSVKSSLTDLDAGDVMTWEVNIKNNGHTLAHDVNWTDTLPTGLSSANPVAVDLTGVPATLSGTGTPLSISNLHGSGTSLYVDKFDLPANSSVKVTFEATLENGVSAGDLLENNTNANYNSIANANGSVDGGRNSLNCGDDDDDSTLNNYCESAKADFTIAADLDIVKQLVGSRHNFTIGEEFSYNLRVSFIDGITKNVIVEDELPSGLKYVSSTCSDPGGTAIAFDCNLLSTSPVTIELGDINNPDDGNKSNNYIDIELRVLVENIKANQNGVVLVNGDTAGTKVTVRSDTNNSSETVPVEITVVEPDIIVTKRVAPATQSRGDVIDYTVTLEHSAKSTNDAFNIEFTDILDAGLTYIPGSSDVNGSQSGQTLTFDIDHFALGETKIIHYKARIDNTIAPDSNLTNHLTTLFRSLPDATGSADGGRNGDDGVGPDDDSVLNNYKLETSATVQVNSNKLKPTKSMRFESDNNNDGLVNAGDFLKYRLNVVNELNTSVNDINISDTIDQNLTLLLNSIKVYHNRNLLVDTGSSNANWTISGYWYQYADNNVTIDYYGDTNYFEVYWNGVFDADDEFDVLYDTKINDGNRTQVVFTDGTTLDINRSQNTKVAAGTVIDNYFTVDSNNTEPADSNEVNITTEERGRALVPRKEITGTDQPFTKNIQGAQGQYISVAVGEVIDVELAYDFTKGITEDTLLSEHYVAGNFVYIPNSTKLSRSSKHITVSQIDLNTSFGLNTLEIAVDDSNLSFRPDGFDLNISDVSVDHYTYDPTQTLYLTFKLRVDNNESVRNAIVLPDHGSVRYLEYDPATSSSSRVEHNSTVVSVTVVEPVVEVKKDVNISTAKVADDLRYTLKVCNEGDTNGYEWNVLDTLPDKLLPSAYTFDDNGTGASIISGGLNGQELNVTIDLLTPNQCVTISVDAVVTSDAEFEEKIHNEVNVTTTSLPDVHPYERTGKDGRSGLNNLYDDSNITVTIEAPNLSKRVAGKKKYYYIGEMVTHSIRAGLPASTEALGFKDIFPTALKYIEKSAILTLPAGASVSYPDIANRETLLPSENGVAFDLGELNISTPGDMAIEVNSTVQNLPSVCATKRFSNYVEMYFEDSNYTGISEDYNTTSGVIVIGEPNLYMTNVLIGYDPKDPKTVGDTISYKVVLHNTGETMAYHLNWYDIIPEHTGNINNMALYVPKNDVNKSDGSGVLGDADFVVVDNNLSLAPFDLPSGSAIEVTFDTEITSLTIEKLKNKAYATTQSAPTGGRTVTQPGCHRAYDVNVDVPFMINQLPIAVDDCHPPLLVTHYGPNPGDLSVNDKLGDGTKAEHTWRLIHPPKHGTVEVHKDGTYIYEPEANYNGKDGFYYEIEDINGDKDQAKVCIDVNCASTQPSDNGDAGSTLSLLLMFMLTMIIGLYYLQDEEMRRRR